LEIQQKAVAWAIASSSAAEIDAINILQASLLAMLRAVEALKSLPDEILVDGLYCPVVSMPARAIVKGDASEQCIAAASILAKTARDAEMLHLHASFPDYGLDRHKGYPTAAHLAALQVHGPASIHRRSFAPVRRLLEGVQS
ncbi:MAG: ribonuclease HII, partial [Proteobacteria bacterium]|nr:ribonuclease HII [Pseudomonadota bacterium]